MPHATLCGMSKRFSLGTVVQQGDEGDRTRGQAAVFGQDEGDRQPFLRQDEGGRGGQAAVFDDKKRLTVPAVSLIRNG